MLCRNKAFALLKLPKRRYSKLAKSKWKSVVGLEVHAQITSESKLFSGSSTKFSSPVNSNVSLFDCAIPGTLPVLNKRCVEAGVLTALALNCRVNPISLFDRKHYFYADLPAGYQITQQRLPLAVDGKLEFLVFTPGVHKTPYKAQVKIKQLQLEQDSGKSLHDTTRTLIDLNRAGVPLMEIVFEPDLKDGEEAAALIKELIGILYRIKTCSCKMEEGALRVDANISIHKEGEPLGVRTEVKNIGSIRGVANAVQYEIARQIEIKESGGCVVNETRAWDAAKKATVGMRDKEVQQDYRYMPEPNLPPLHIAMGPVERGCVNADKLKETLPELPEETRRRLQSEGIGLSSEQVIVLVNDIYLLKLFEDARKTRRINCKLLANFLINDFNYILNKNKLEAKDIICDGDYFGEIVELLESRQINRDVAKILLEEIVSGNRIRPKEIVEEKELSQIIDTDELTMICEGILNENQKAVKDYKSGKTKALNALLRAVSAKSKNRADMLQCTNILKELLSK